MTVRRFGQVIRVRPETIEADEALHADPWPAVAAAIHAANIRDHSIYRHQKWLFARSNTSARTSAAPWPGWRRTVTCRRGGP